MLGDRQLPEEPMGRTRPDHLLCKRGGLLEALAGDWMQAGRHGVPPFYSCDWRWRVEHFGPDNGAQQWTLSDEDSLQVTLAYLQILFRDFVLPAATTMTTEAELLKHSGGFEFPQLKTRAVILAATNQVSALKQTVSTLIEKFGSGIAGKGTREHLEMLRSKYPEAMRGIELPANVGFR
jgi:hypothetical protein